MWERTRQFLSSSAVLNGVTVFAIVAMLLTVALVAYQSATLGLPPSPRTLSANIEQNALELAVLKVRMQAIEDTISNLDQSEQGKLAISTLDVRQRQNSDRIGTLETNLDMQPRELIELLLLREKLSTMQDDTAGAVEALRFEVDRVFTMGITLLGTLFASVLLLLLTNLVRRPDKAE